MILLQARDIGAWNFFQGIRPPWIEPVVLAISFLGSMPAVLAVMIVAQVHYLTERRLRPALFLLAGFAGGVLLVHLVQPMVGRDRMVGRTMIEQPRTPWSFPDEVTLMATVTYLGLGILAADRNPERRRSILLGIGFLVFLIGLARMLVGISFPSDVLGGWLSGTAWVLFCRWWAVPQVASSTCG
jgi:undecaprenyl-diphosphatase